MNYNVFLSIGFSVCALAFELVIIFLYTIKKRFRNIENTLFITLLVLTSLLILSEIGYVLELDKSNTVTFAARFLSRLYLNYMILWLFLFMFYLTVLRTKRYEEEIKKEKRKKYAYILAGFCVVCLIVSNLLGIEYYDYTNHIYNFTGDASYVAFAVAGVVIFLMIYGFIFNQTIKTYLRIPIIYCVVLIIVSTLLQFMLPDADYNIQNFQFTLMLLTLYFTIESQDTKLLDEHEKSKIEADKANQEQTQFLTSMSHEIRTPMNTIMGFSDAMLREKELTKEIIDSDTKNINVAAVSLLELINNILDLSRIESGKETIVEKEFDLENLFTETNDYISKKIDRTKIELLPKIETMLPKKCVGDYTKITKIIDNVISNISYYVNKGTITFDVHSIQQEEKKYLEFTISSSNSNLEEEEYERYYKDFENLGNDINDIVLGINVAKKYSEMLGGNLEFKYGDNQNITYIIKLEEQVIDPNPIGDVTYLFTSKNEENKILDLSTKNILVVDDNQININLLKRLLKDYKANIDSVTSGLEAIDSVQKKTYDLIFLDHMMPVMDGIETIHKLKDTISNLCPVIALTANSYTGIREMYIGEGFKDYLAKPINRSELSKLINEIFNN